MTPEGFEKTFAIGYLSAILLCTELAPALAKGEQARIVNVAGVPAMVLKADRLDLSDLNFEKNYSGMRVAIDTIHAKTVASEILAEKFADQGICVNSFHPGAVKGDVFRNMSSLKKSLFSFMNLFMATTS